MAYHFLNANFATKGLFDHPENPVPYISGENATGGLEEYGVRVEGTWEDEVEKVLKTESRSTARTVKSRQ